MEYSQDKFLTDCYLFNILASKSKVIYGHELKDQADRILEEVKELKEAVDENDPAGMLDGLIDILVTSYGFKQLLESQGYQVEKGSNKVAMNNLSKFVFTEEAADSTIEHYKQKGTDCYKKKSKSGMIAILRKSDNKVMKPLGYGSVDLTDCLPV